MRRLHARADPHRLSWQDRGWLAGVHPLELWLVRHLSRHPEADRSEALSGMASHDGAGGTARGGRAGPV